MRTRTPCGIENQVLAAVEKAEIIQYSVTPVYDGGNKIPLGVRVDAYGTNGGLVRAGNAHRDGCNTRAEVLLEEAVTAPEQGTGCRLTGGSWHSPYDDTYFTAARGLDIDHLVPLAEAWDSGASAWTAKEREA